MHQLEPMLAILEATLEEAGIEDRPQALAANTGYWPDQLDVASLEQEDPELYLATASRSKEARARQEEESPRTSLPGSA